MSSDNRCTAFANVGFTRGIHYWEIKLETASEPGTIFIGVSEKRGMAKLKQWSGCGFVNFRATSASGAERIYGQHFHNGDTVGVLLDCDAGRLSFFLNAIKYGEHILNDMGVAYENTSPFGFNADGCGTGGAGEGAPSLAESYRGGRYLANGIVRPKALWPVIGLRHSSDRVTISEKWISSSGYESMFLVKNVLAVDEMLSSYYGDRSSMLPKWAKREGWNDFNRWQSTRWLRSQTRGSCQTPLVSMGLDIDFDTSAVSCALACALLGLDEVFLSGEFVMIKRSAGRILEMPEEAVVLGVYQERLFYRIQSQRTEGGSLREGGGRAWCFDESEVVSEGVSRISKSKAAGIYLPRLQRFLGMPLQVVFDDGAVVRSDLEIDDFSSVLCTVAKGEIISHVLERRVNSCGVVRFRVLHGDFEGWISERIRGGNEDVIVEKISGVVAEENSVEVNVQGNEKFLLPEDSAQVWNEEFMKRTQYVEDKEAIKIEFSEEEYENALDKALINGLTCVESDAFLVHAVTAVSDVLPCGNALLASFNEIASALEHGISLISEGVVKKSTSLVATHLVAASLFKSLKPGCKVPLVKDMMARISMLRAFNRRVLYGLPFVSTKPAQEGSAILGGTHGFGTGLDRVGRQCNVNNWVDVPSLAKSLRDHRNLIFSSVKRTLFDSIIGATTTPTPLNHDEYELPREIRTVRINRLKARRAAGSSKKKFSVFSQMRHEMRSWSTSALRRSYTAKGHGGQKRAFKVKLVGEGVNDYSGPYREVFTDITNEVQEVNSDGSSLLDLLVPSPNKISDIGDRRDLYVFSSSEKGSNPFSFNEMVEKSLGKFFSSVLTQTMREREEGLFFLGKIVGTACRHSIMIDLNLPLGLVWKKIAEEKVLEADIIREVDVLGRKSKEEEIFWFLASQQRLLNFFVDGIASVLPTEIFSLFTSEEVEALFCGKRDIDIKLLEEVVEYEGYLDSDPVIIFFWEVLREFTSDQRKAFLQFVWARNRLPTKASDFEAPFKILKDNKILKKGEAEGLPSASTCFFSLTLPNYKSKDLLRTKLSYAIENVFTMEQDFITNDTEVGEGWRM
mmetsp:Transcript_40145/g.94371  ORF Transcript_40145/g.94371 Transcript_40145/m.94371 type:complete len:1076 (-) Transcript_40145:319-3546(-)